MICLFQDRGSVKVSIYLLYLFSAKALPKKMDNTNCRLEACGSICCLSLDDICCGSGCCPTASTCVDETSGFCCFGGNARCGTSNCYDSSTEIWNCLSQVNDLLRDILLFCR
ncbi:hypothetical protein VTN96DRAFT_6109 [Rasamsonia emersonii]